MIQLENRAQIKPQNTSLKIINYNKNHQQDAPQQSQKKKLFTNTSTSSFVNFEQFIRSSGKLVIKLFDAYQKKKIASSQLWTIYDTK